MNNENFENLIAQVFRHKYEEQVYQISKLSTVHGKSLRHLKNVWQPYRQPHRHRSPPILWASFHEAKKGVPAWYDSECRLKRSLAIRAGERVTNPTQRENQLAACREYRATKQRKQRKFISKCIDDINYYYHIYDYYIIIYVYFIDDLENIAIDFLNE